MTNRADLNGDLRVGPADLGQLLGAWGVCSGLCPSDLNCDGTVGAADLGILLGTWTGTDLVRAGDLNCFSDEEGDPEMNLEQALNLVGFQNASDYKDWVPTAPEDLVSLYSALIRHFMNQ